MLVTIHDIWDSLFKERRSLSDFAKFIITNDDGIDVLKRNIPQDSPKSLKISLAAMFTTTKNFFHIFPARRYQPGSYAILDIKDAIDRVNLNPALELFEHEIKGIFLMAPTDVFIGSLPVNEARFLFAGFLTVWIYILENLT